MHTNSRGRGHDLATRLFPSAKRMHTNSRGRQPTENRDETDSTLKGSHHKTPDRTRRVAMHRLSVLLFGPFRAGDDWGHEPWVAPTAIHIVRLQRTTAKPMTRCLRRATVKPMTRSAICSARDLQRGLDFALATRLFPSAKRMHTNSRGRQPTEQRAETDSTLKGSHHQPPDRTRRVRPMHRRLSVLLFGPFRADDNHGRVPWVAPTAIHIVRLQRTTSRPMPSAKRMNTNSRGCQPTEQRDETNPTLKGSHPASFRPFRAGLFVCCCSVGFTHGYSCCSPPANRRRRAFIRCWMLNVKRWMFPPSHV
jgi:hypothetical protein